jgi:hypothetical protein
MPEPASEASLRARLAAKRETLERTPRIPSLAAHRARLEHEVEALAHALAETMYTKPGS